MIAKLEADADAEASQKEWCDEAMTKAMSMRDENIGEMEGDTATVVKSESTIAKLKEEIAQLTNEIAELNKGLSEATTLRGNERAENEKTLADANQGLAGVKKAIEILKGFYDNALVQTGAKYVPPGADASGKTVGDMAPDAGFSEESSGNQDAASGIMGMLSVIESDFDRSITTVTDEEAEAEDAFTTYKEETETTISEKESLIDSKTGEKKETTGVLEEGREDLAPHQDEGPGQGGAHE